MDRIYDHPIWSYAVAWEKEKNEMIFYNGVAGVWAFIFFMLLLGFASDLGRF